MSITITTTVETITTTSATTSATKSNTGTIKQQRKQLAALEKTVCASSHRLSRLFCVRLSPHTRTERERERAIGLTGLILFFFVLDPCSCSDTFFCPFFYRTVTPSFKLLCNCLPRSLGDRSLVNSSQKGTSTNYLLKEQRQRKRRPSTTSYPTTHINHIGVLTRTRRQSVG